MLFEEEENDEDEGKEENENVVNAGFNGCFIRCMQKRSTLRGTK